MQQTGEHFERGGLARAVGTNQANHGSRFDGETHILHGGDFTVPRVEQAFQRGGQPFGADGDAVGFGQVLDLDEGVGHGKFPTVFFVRLF